MIDGDLSGEVGTSMSSTCSLTVVVKPSLESVFPPKDIIRSLRLTVVRICNKIISMAQDRSIIAKLGQASELYVGRA